MKFLIGASSSFKECREKQAKTQVSANLQENISTPSEKSKKFCLKICESDQVQENIFLNKRQNGQQKQLEIQLQKKSSNSSSRSKLIKKSKGKQNQSNSLSSAPSNVNKKLLSLIKDHLSFYKIYPQFEEKYVNAYQINNQRQNLVIVPFILLDFLIKVVRQNSRYGIQEVQKNQEKIQIQVQKITKQLHSLLKNIFNQFKNSIQKSQSNRSKKNENDKKLQKKNKQSYSYYTFLKIANYFQKQIPDLFLEYIEQVQNLSGKINFKQLKQKVSIQNQSYSIKIQEEVTLMYINPNEDKQKQKCSKSQNLKQNCEKYIQSMFQSKEREIKKAYDKLYSIILNEPNLRYIFNFSNDYKLDLKKILVQSRQYIFRRFFGNQKNKHQKQLIQNYKTLQQDLGQNLTLREDFCISLAAISLAQEKNAQILRQFIETIQRKIQFIDDKNQESQAQISKIKYTKKYYQNCLNILRQNQEALILNSLSKNTKEKQERQQSNLKLQIKNQKQIWNSKIKIQQEDNQEEQIKYQPDCQLISEERLNIIKKRYEALRDHKKYENQNYKGIQLLF